MKIEVLSDELNAEFAGKVPKREKLESLMLDVLDHCKLAKMCGNDGLVCSDAKVLVIVCQMLWNELERKNEECDHLKKAISLM